MAAFNFEKDDNTVTGFEKRGRDAPSIAATGVERTSLAEHTEFTTGGIYTATVNGEEKENKEQRAKETANDWEYDWMDDQDKGGEQWEGNEDNDDEAAKGGENEATATETLREEGGDDMPLMHKVMRQLDEMRKRDALVEEQHKAEVAQLREALAAATSTPQEEAGGEQRSATETTQEGATVAKPQTERVTNDVASDPLTSA